jgi:hypothetical protein
MNATGVKADPMIYDALSDLTKRLGLHSVAAEFQRARADKFKGGGNIDVTETLRRNGAIISIDILNECILMAKHHGTGAHEKVSELLIDLRNAGLVPTDETIRRGVDMCQFSAELNPKTAAWATSLALLRCAEDNGILVGQYTLNKAAEVCMACRKAERARTILRKMFDLSLQATPELRKALNFEPPTGPSPPRSPDRNDLDDDVADFEDLLKGIDQDFRISGDFD